MVRWLGRILSGTYDEAYQEQALAVGSRAPTRPVFDAFFSTKPGSTGLGLAIARRILSEHGDTMGVESRPGHTCFRFAIPVVGASSPHLDKNRERVEDADFALNSGAERDVSVLVQDLRNRNDLDVLVVDDGVLDRRLARIVLESFGHRVETASGGCEGVTMALARRFDAVVIDLHMPDLDGREAAREIRVGQRRLGSRATPIIALSADEPDHASTEFDAYLTKPAAPDTLHDALLRVTRPTILVAQRVAHVTPELAKEFLEKARADVASMWSAFERSELGTIEFKAHRLKGTGRAFGFPAISALGATIEQRAQAQSKEGIEGWLCRLNGLLDRA